ncbi:MAG TPA: D-glycerate dehydrogenase [Devosia sp.]|nr:D-glycerate dehydrogenase [Devosia sp.]
MNSEKARVFVTQRLPKSVETRMSILFETRFSPHDGILGADEILAGVSDCNVLVSTINDPLNADLINRLPEKVRLIAQYGNGVDNVDVVAARKRNIVVTNTPSVVTEDTANMAMALILSVPRRIVEGASLMAQKGKWPGWSPTWMLGRRLTGKSLGIVGMGRIGMAVAHRARAVGLSIHYYSRSRHPEPVESSLKATYWPQLDDMLKEVDIVSLHTPHTPETFRLLDRRRLELLKPGAFVVNVSRSELIEENALVDLVGSGHLSGAGLDVFEDAGGINPDLLELARQHKVVLTPHMASSTLEGRIEMGETVILNIQVFMDSHNPPHRVLV